MEVQRTGLESCMKRQRQEMASTRIVQELDVLTDLGPHIGLLASPMEGARDCSMVLHCST